MTMGDISVKENGVALPEGWVVKTLASIGLINPKVPSSMVTSDEMEVQFLPMKLVEEETGRISLIETRRLGDVKKGYTSFIDNDVIFAKVTPCMENGKIAMVTGLKNSVGFGSSEFHVIRSLEKTNPKYLFFFLIQMRVRWEAESEMTGAVGLRRVPKAFLENLEIPLPPIAEQHRIVSKIEELFSELEKGKEQILLAQQQLKTYRQAVLKWAFEGRLTDDFREANPKLKSAKEILAQLQGKREGEKVKKEKWEPLDLQSMSELPQSWQWERLGAHAFVTKLAGFEFTKYVHYSDDGEIPVIRAQNVAKASFVPRNFLYVPRKTMEQLPRSRVYGGEILMVFVGAGLGNVGIVPQGQQYFLGPNVAKIAVNSHFDNKFVFYFLSSTGGFANVNEKSKATAQGSISMGNIREVAIPLLSLEEQHRIVQEIESRLSVCDAMEATLQTSLAQAEVLRQSILKRAFEGRLV